MPSFQDQMVSDLNVFFNTSEFAKAIVYNGTSIKAIVFYLRNLDIASSGVAQRAELIVKRSDVASPQNMDLAIFDGLSWNVENVEVGDDQTWRLRIRRAESVIFQ